MIAPMISHRSKPRDPLPRRSQPARSAATRARLLDATIASLVEAGFTGTTTGEVCRRAGVSHGALLHHYGTRLALLGATLEHLYERLRTPVEQGLAALPGGPERLDALVDLLWAVFGSSEFKAVLELWVASANDPALRQRVAPATDSFDASIQPTAAGLFPDLARDVSEFPALVSLLFQIMQGMALTRAVFRSADSESRRPEVIALTKRLLHSALAAERRPPERAPTHREGDPA